MSSQDDNAEENIDWKINLYLQLELPHLNFIITYVSTVKFQMET